MEMPARHGTSIVWFRRDLRLNDHVALARAASESERVVCAFVLDPDLLRGPTIGAPIAAFFFDALASLRSDLRSFGSDLALLEGDFERELLALAKRVGADALYYNRDYEPHAIARDERVTRAFEKAGAAVSASLDHVYFGADETLKDDGEPYTVYTPFKRRWLARDEDDRRGAVDSHGRAKKKFATRAAIGTTRDVPAPDAFGMTPPEHARESGERVARALLDRFVSSGAIEAYAEARDFPAVTGTAHLSPHLRAGTIGIRTCVDAARAARHDRRGAAAAGIETWLGELVWRDFYQQILANFPRVATGPFDERATKLRYRTSEREWEAWCAGRTGYPIVDAAMRQINTYGWMHNRLRMIVASFLTKDLLLDYRRGEAYFEQHLVDGDKAANNGGWQWSASTGTDAAPYFRIFNPVTQSKRFDPDGAFIRRMVPELAQIAGDAIHAPWTLAPLDARAAGVALGETYPMPIVDHAEARVRALAAYAPVLGKASKTV